MKTYFFQTLLKQERKNTNMHFLSQMVDHTLQNHQISANYKYIFT